MTIGWWNTGLSPTKSPNRASPQELEAAATVVHRLLDVDGVDFLALCEVSPEDMVSIKQALGAHLGDFESLDCQEQAGLSRFDTALIYRKNLIVHKGQTVAMRKLNRTTRVAQRFNIETAGGTVFRTFVSHWPSRARLGALDADRLNLGNNLRSAVGLAFETDLTTPLLLMGDFNDEPFDPSIDNALLSSRDRALVIKNPELLYNPFWRHMSWYRSSDDNPTHHHKGTYYYPSGITTQWHTFDQMMFSSSVISGSSGWMLDEALTKVVEFPELLDLIEQRKSIFDHLPIIGCLTESQSND